MAQYSHLSTVNFPLETVLQWHRRPGALTRLTPHWAGSVEKEAHSLEPGNTSVVQAAVPGTRGLLTQKWVSEQTALSEDSFTDRMVAGPLKSWEHTHDFLTTSNQTIIRDTIDFEALPIAQGTPVSPALKNLPRSAAHRVTSLLSTAFKKTEPLAQRRITNFVEAMFNERNRRLEADLLFHDRYDSPSQTVVISGASGMVGTQIRALLTGGGHTVRTLVRREPSSPNEFAWDPDKGTIDLAAFDGADAVIHLGGASINTRFTEKNKKKILESRQKSTILLAETLAKLAPTGGPRTFICASAIGYYGSSRAGELLREESAAGDDFLAEVCQVWEAACEPARAAGIRVVNVRTGVVQSALGGALRLQLPLFLTGTGGAVGKGENMQSWVSLDDIAGIYVHAVLTDSLEGPVNAVAPTPVTAKKLAKTVGQAVHRPVVLPIPRLGPQLLLKKQGADELALADQNVSCSKLEQSGYTFFETDLLTALRHELG